MNNKPSEEYLEKMRHSFAHVLAQAVMRIYPDAKMGIGPVIEDGFYYDFDLGQPFEHEQLPEIEAEMKRIMAEDLVFKQLYVSRDQAFDTLHHLGQIYKTELLQQVPDDRISFYKTGDEFIDLCRGPHLDSTAELGAFKLTKLTKTHWLGDESRPEMVRIQGIAFASKEDLENFLAKQEELELRNHIRLGKEIGVFTNDEQSNKGFPQLLPNGFILKKAISDFLYTELSQDDYKFIETTALINEHQLRATNFLSFENRNLFTPFNIADQTYRLRPINYINHFNIYKTKKHSYKEMPLKFSELADVYFNLGENELNGLIASRKFTADTSHIFSIYEDSPKVLSDAIKLNIEILKGFGVHDYRFEITLPYPDKPNLYIGQEQSWREAIWIIEKALSEIKIVARQIEGRASFFGPELSIIIKDQFKREWKLFKFLVDNVQPKILGIKYIDNKGAENTPVVIHQNILGSIERFMAYLIEEYGGAFPLWLAPLQTTVIPISNKFIKEAKNILKSLQKAGIRTFLDARDETMQAKIRDAQLEKVPYMIIIGEKEVTTNSISVRPRSGQDLGLMRLEEFIDKLKAEINSKE